MSLINREALIAEYDRVHVGTPGGARKLMVDAPEVKPEKRWIPVSERLPEIDMSYSHGDMYLVQYESGDMDVAQWSNANLFWALHVTEPYWICDPYTKVIAWMPLPEPYKQV